MNDFLIIGGGIGGLSVAAGLATLGKVCVLEGEDALGYHASGRSAALFAPNYGSPSTIALNHASVDRLRAAGVLSPRGLMLVGRSDEAERAEQDIAQMRLARITTDEARARVPILNETLHIAAWQEDAEDIDTDRLLQGFARQARANGAVHLKSRVTALQRTGAGWQAQTATGVHEGRILVNAAGPWLDEIAAMAGIAPVGVQAFRRSMARIPAPGGHDIGGWPMLLGPGESWYAKPDAGSLLVSPAEEDPQPPHDAWVDDMTLAEGLARYEAIMTEPVTRLQSSWAGLRSFAPDRELVIGFAPDAPDVFWHGCLGGYGFQTAFAAAALATDLIAGRPPELEASLVAALSPARLKRPVA